MYKEQDKQTTFFGDFIYQQIIPKDHFLRRLKETIDFSFVNEQTKHLYCEDNGRPCWEPQIIFKMLFLQYLYDLSDDEIEQQCLYRIDFKYFLGLDINVSAPDSTTLVRFRDRLGADGFAKIFNHIVEIAKKYNLVSEKLHIVDATYIKAKVDVYKIKKKHKIIDNHTPDKDAAFGHSTENKVFYGYKGYLRMDKESEIITSCCVSSANKQEANHLEMLLDKSPPETILADRAFDTPQNQTLLKSLNIRSLILCKQPKVSKNLSGCFYQPKTKQSKKLRNYIVKTRASIEHKIAELKRYHGLSKCRFWGLIKTKIQLLLSVICVNVKKIINLITQNLSPPSKSICGKLC